MSLTSNKKKKAHTSEKPDLGYQALSEGAQLSVPGQGSRGLRGTVRVMKN